MKTKRMILAGGSGFLGRALAAHLVTSGWEVVIITRSRRQNGGLGRFVQWTGDWQRELDGASAVVNLTGKSVNCRYNARNRQEILDSRVNSTCALGEAIDRCADPPTVWLNASMATIYTHAFKQAWDEAGETAATPDAKDAFSVEVAQAWEHALVQAPTPRTRKVAMRMAMVLGHGKNSVFPT